MAPASATDVAGAPTASAPEAYRFPRPAELEPQIAFWKKIFTEYSTHQVVVHDALYLDKIYTVLDFRGHLDDGMTLGEVDNLRKAVTDLEINRIYRTLMRLDGLGPNPEGLSPEEGRIFDLFADIRSPYKFREAADAKRLRSQRGLRERFGEGIRVSRRYFPEMERIFRDAGLPVELTRLPLIESCFNLAAYSKVGAAGIWQFMPSTGRRYLRVDEIVDERRDPLYATQAAAGFLTYLYHTLGSWPLAITAYNHGPEGIARAVDEVGSARIERIVRDYRGRAFGFASRNFYAEFLAALDVDREPAKYFGEMPVDPPARARVHRLPRAVGIDAAARIARTDSDEIARLNPSLLPIVVSGRRAIPEGYRLRVPEAGADGFETRLAALPPEPRARVVQVATRSGSRKGRTTARSAYVTHRVKPGQTLSEIAKKHGVSVASLRSANRLNRSGTIRAGQTLRVPVSAGEA